MEIEILYDPMEHLASTGLQMDERHELLPDGEFIHWINRITGRKDLFLYRHRQHETFVLAQWLNRDNRICNELEVWHAPPDWIQEEIDGELYWRTRLCSAEEGVERMKRTIRERNYERRAAKQDSAEQRKGAIKYLKNKGMEEEAGLLATGVPYVGKREAALQGTESALGDLKA